MKQKIFTLKNVPYLLSGLTMIAGGAIIYFGYALMGPVTRDPDIGAGLLLLFGYFLVGVGAISGLVLLLVRKFHRSKNK